MAIINRAKIDSKVLTDVVEDEIMNFLRENYHEIHDNVEFEWNGSECIVNIRGKLHIQNMKMTKMTNGQFRFGKAQSVDISLSNIETLEGCPTYVSGDFNCRLTRIKDLTGLGTIGGDLCLSDCQNLTSLKGAPVYLGGSVYMKGCKNIKDFGHWEGRICGEVHLEGSIFNRLEKELG